MVKTISNLENPSPDEAGKVTGGSTADPSTSTEGTTTNKRNRVTVSYHGKDYVTSKKGCLNLDYENPLRKVMFYIIKSAWFDNIILFFILANAVLMGMQDYTVIDAEGSPAATDYRNPDKTSAVNAAGDALDIVFTIIFTVEMIFKILALGFVFGPNAYLKDGWNDLDFVVVISSLVSLIPGVPNVSALRTLRVLRPLKSLKMLPGMKMLINSMLYAIGPLANVVILLIVVFAIFGILGIQLFMGAGHYRCRMTKFPVKMPRNNLTEDLVYASDIITEEYMAKVLADPQRYRCIDQENDNSAWTQASSPWSTPQDCFWPLVDGDTRVCSPGTGGKHKCNSELNQSCGSVYDMFGNKRFSDPDVMRTMDNEIPELMFGYLGFDDMLQAFLTIFQSITEEGWVDIMYVIMDGVNPVVGALYFILMILFGSFLLLNLTLAVLEDSLSYNKEMAEKEEEEELERSGISAETDAKSDGGELKFFEPRQKCRMPFFTLVTNPYFDGFIVFLIIVNTIVLGLDHHPMDPAFEAQMEIINFVLTVLFTIEMVLKLIGLGPYQYVLDGYNRFDGVIVIFSIVELALSPPQFLAPGNKGTAGGISALRSFRLFRIFKLARSWTDLRIILEKIIMTLRDVSNFGVLLVLFMYILALVGMQFFANRLRFDEYGVPVPFGKYHAYDPKQLKYKDQPPAHFDTIGWSFVTIFQVLSGENWNTVMYDCMRGTGVAAVLFFLILVIVGNFIILNLFLAILLINFDGLADEQDEQADMFEQSETDHANELENGEKPKKTGVMAVICGCLTSKTASIKVRPELLGDDESMGRSPTIDTVDNFSFNSSKSSKGRQAEETKVSSFDQVDTDDEGGMARINAPDTQTFQPQIKVVRRSSVNAPSVSHSMSTNEGDMVATVYIKLQDGTRHEITTTNNLEKGGLTFTVGQFQTEVFKKTNVSAEDQELTWKGIVWDTNARVFKKKKLFEIGVRPNDTIHLRDVFGRAMFVFSENNRFRLFVRKICRMKLFENFILILIVTSSVMLAVESPFWEPGSTILVIFNLVDIVMTALFTLEMLMKMIAFGIISTRGAYLTKGWNILDFIIVGVSILSLASSGNTALKSLRALRTLRALRPLRMISRRPQLKLVVNALFAAIPNVINVLIVCILFLMIFAIFTTGYMKGILMHCDFDSRDDVSDLLKFKHENLVTYPESIAYLESKTYNVQTDSIVDWQLNSTDLPLSQSELFFKNKTISTTYLGIPSPDNKPYSYELCVKLGYKWDRVVPQNFNNVLFSLGALFELSTTEGWVDVMYASIAARGVGMQPVRDTNGIWAVYWILFIIVGSFFVMNLFVGVVIEAFNNQKSDRDGDAIEKALFTDEEQKHWIKTQQILLRLDPKKIARPPNNPNRKKVWMLVMDSRFEWGIMACIVINTLTMGIKTFGQSHTVTLVIEYLNYLFATIFTIEAILKLYGFGPKGYFKVGWNVFDFTVVVATLAGYIIKAATGVSIGSMATVVRGFRIARLFRLIRGAPKLRELVNTIILTLPALGNISGVLLMLFFIYAVMGVQLFAYVKLGDALNDQANFQNFWGAMLMLMRSATGENWNGVMYELANTDECKPEVAYDSKMCGFDDDVHNCIPLDGCGSPAAYVYYVSFTLFVTYVFLNLFIAVILEASEISADEEKDALSEDHLHAFMIEWLKYDPDCKLSITTKQFKDLLQLLEKPMGFGKEYVASEKELDQLFMELELPLFTNDNKEPIVLFMDTVHALAARVHEQHAQSKGKTLKGMEDLPVGSKMDKLRREAMLRNMKSAGIDESSNVTYTTHELSAVARIQRQFKAHKLRREINARAAATNKAKNAGR